MADEEIEGQIGPRDDAAAGGGPAAEDAVAAFLEGFDPEWVRRDGFYRAVVAFGQRDTATLCIIPGETAELALTLVGEFYADLAALGSGATEQDIGATVRGLLGDERRDSIWKALDEIIARSLVSWSVPEMLEIYGMPADSPPPNAGMDGAARLGLLRSLPLAVIVRMLLGVLWLAKNSLGRSR